MSAPELKMIISVLNKTKTGLKGVLGSMKRFGSRMKGIGKTMGKSFLIAGASIIASLAGIGYALQSSVKDVIKYGDSLGKMRARIGYSSDALQKWKYILEITGSSVNAFEKANKSMARTIYDAGRGTKTAIDALASLGTSYEELVNLSPEEQFNKLRKALSKVTNETKQSALAQEVFKRSGFDLLNLIRTQESEIQALMNDYKELGIALSDMDIKSAEEAADSFHKLGLIIGGIKKKFAAALLPLLNKINDAVIKMWKSFVASGGVERALQAINNFLEEVRAKLAPLKGIMADIFSGDIELKTAALDKLKAQLREIASFFGEKLGEAIAKGIAKGTKAILKKPIKDIQNAPKNILDTLGGVKTLEAEDSNKNAQKLREAGKYRQADQTQERERNNFWTTIKRGSLRIVATPVVAPFAPLILANKIAKAKEMKAISQKPPLSDKALKAISQKPLEKPSLSDKALKAISQKPLEKPSESNLGPILAASLPQAVSAEGTAPAQSLKIAKENAEANKTSAVKNTAVSNDIQAT